VNAVVVNGVGVSARLRPRWRAAALGACGVLVALLVAPAAGAVDAPDRARSAPTVAAGVTTGPDRVSLLGQPSWVVSGGTFDLHLAVSASDPGTDLLQVAAYPRLTTRTGFEQAAAGNDAGLPWYGVEPLKTAQQDAQGGIDVRIPVNAPATGADLKAFYTGDSGSGVYPLRIQLFTAEGVPLGAALSTFLVYDGGTTDFSKLAVSLVVPIGAAPAVDAKGVPGAPSASAVGTLATTLASIDTAGHVPVTLAVTPQTIDALRAGPLADRQVVSRIAALASDGDEVLIAPYVSVSLSGLNASGLAGQIGQQLVEGTAALQAGIGVTPSRSVWAVDGALDASTLSVLRGVGLQRLVVPDGDLSSLPGYLQTTTFGRPTPLADGPGRAVEVFGADPVLSGRITAPGGPVLAADQDLAELAMIQLETPSLDRGEAVLAPAGVSPTFLRTFLAGLAGNPFATAVTESGLFARVTPLAAPDGGPTRHLIAGAPSGGIAGLDGVRSLDSSIRSFAGLAPQDTALSADLRRRMLVAESGQLAPDQRSAVVGSALRAIHRIEGQIGLPGATSITLTSESATVPITIQSDPSLTVHVEVSLASTKLQFRHLVPADGTCQVLGSSAETCELTLHGAATTLRVPVETRTSGVFPLDVSLYAPGPAALLATERDTIRSTAVSFVGLVLMVGAGLFLGVWWFRNIRHGRRARRLIPPPGDDPGDGGAGGDDPDGTAPAPPPPCPDPQEAPVRPLQEPVTLPWFAEDPVVARFFAAPPPADRGSLQPVMSPSKRSDGRNQRPPVRRGP
jgi:hypothetical protein